MDEVKALFGAAAARRGAVDGAAAAARPAGAGAVGRCWRCAAAVLHAAGRSAPAPRPRRAAALARRQAARALLGLVGVLQVVGAASGGDRSAAAARRICGAQRRLAGAGGCRASAGAQRRRARCRPALGRPAGDARLLRRLVRLVQGDGALHVHRSGGAAQARRRAAAEGRRHRQQRRRPRAAEALSACSARPARSSSTPRARRSAHARVDRLPEHVAVSCETLRAGRAVTRSTAACAVLNCQAPVARWSSLVARWAHNPKVAGSNPALATKFRGFRFLNAHRPVGVFAGSVEQPAAARIWVQRAPVDDPDSSLVAVARLHRPAGRAIACAALDGLRVRIGARRFGPADALRALGAAHSLRGPLRSFRLARPLLHGHVFVPACADAGPGCPAAGSRCVRRLRAGGARSGQSGDRDRRGGAAARRRGHAARLGQRAAHGRGRVGRRADRRPARSAARLHDRADQRHPRRPDDQAAPTSSAIVDAVNRLERRHGRGHRRPGRRHGAASSPSHVAPLAGLTLARTAPSSSPATTSTTRARRRGSPSCGGSACACC